MSSPLQTLVETLGRFHPLLVHLPIGGLLGLAILEVLAKCSRFKKAAQCNTLILALASIAALVSAASGWLLSGAGHYDPQLLRWHKWTGIIVAVGCSTSFLLNLRRWLGAYHLSLWATVAAVVVAGHLGGSMTYGRGFLTRNLRPPQDPPFLHSNRPTSFASDLDGKEGFYHAFVQPLLQEHCASCHGPEKQEADLRLDTLEALQRGGISGPVLVPGRARDSLLIQRLLVPEGDDNHMPPDGRPSLSPLESGLLAWWVENEIVQEPKLPGPDRHSLAGQDSKSPLQASKPRAPAGGAP